MLDLECRAWVFIHRFSHYCVAKHQHLPHSGDVYHCPHWCLDCHTKAGRVFSSVDPLYLPRQVIHHFSIFDIQSLVTLFTEAEDLDYFQQSLCMLYIF